MAVSSLHEVRAGQSWQLEPSLPWEPGRYRVAVALD